MSINKAIANRLRRTLTGPMWHGPAVSELLANVTPEMAAQRPIPEGHSIWELVEHIAVWAEISRDRMAGRSRAAPPPELDFPRAPTPPTQETWKTATTRLTEAYRLLADDTKAMTPGQLEQLVPGEKYSVTEMLYGVVEHGTYHGGQIALLTKAMTRTS